MSLPPEPEALGPQVRLFDHALRLHRDHPDHPLPRDGEPYPDDRLHRRPHARPKRPEDARKVGIEAAALLDQHFAQDDPHPEQLAHAFHQVYVPIFPNDHITAAAHRADQALVAATGRWLVRHAADRCAATIGLALLASDWNDEDIPLIQTIGLLHSFGPLAAHALLRRRGGDEALLWLAKRVSGWGRVHVVEALCKIGSSDARSWLLRHSCDGDYLNGYFAGKVATTAHLHEAITHPDAGIDDALVDNTGRLLSVMSDCSGMGMDLNAYPPAGLVLAAHAHLLARQEPTADRYMNAAVLLDHLVRTSPGSFPQDRGHVRRAQQTYRQILDRDEWRETIRTHVQQIDDETTAWFLTGPAARLGLEIMQPGRP